MVSLTAVCNRVSRDGLDSLLEIEQIAPFIALWDSKRIADFVLAKLVF